MTDCFVGELRIFSSASLNNIPDGWIPCEGQMLQVSQNAALFALLGTQFGGNGQTTFGVPDLRSRVIVAAQPSATTKPYAKVGGTGGTETVALTNAQVPVHTHTAKASTATDSAGSAPNNNYIGVAVNGAQATAASLYTPVTGISDMLPLSQSSLTAAGGGAAHENRQMVLALRICIATLGIFPQRP